MRVGIMQPYFLPYLGYFSLIKHVDRFILLDEVQFIRHGWIERNRILKPSEGWQYFRVPLLRHHRETLIREIQIDNLQRWQERIMAQIAHYQKRAPYFDRVGVLLASIFSQEYERIAQLNQAALSTVCHYLGISTEITMFSAMELTIDPVNSPDEWALNICRRIPGVDEYWNPPGGKGFFDPDKYEANKIALRFQQVRLSEYQQGRTTFEPGLSIVDVMMFNDVEQINEMLDDYELL